MATIDDRDEPSIDDKETLADHLKTLRGAINGAKHAPPHERKSHLTTALGEVVEVVLVGKARCVLTNHLLTRCSDSKRFDSLLADAVRPIDNKPTPPHVLREVLDKIIRLLR